ncbi:hypothetical protein ACLK1W_11075 [Escherichia coli]
MSTLVFNGIALYVYTERLFPITRQWIITRYHRNIAINLFYQAMVDKQQQVVDLNLLMILLSITLPALLALMAITPRLIQADYKLP